MIQATLHAPEENGKETMEEDCRSLIDLALKFRTCSFISGSEDYAAVRRLLTLIDMTLACALMEDEVSSVEKDRIKFEAVRLSKRVTPISLSECLENGWSLSQDNGNRSGISQMQFFVLEDSVFRYLDDHKQAQPLHKYLTRNPVLCSMLAERLAFGPDGDLAFRSGYILTEDYPQIEVSIHSESFSQPWNYVLVKPVHEETIILKGDPLGQSYLTAILALGFVDAHGGFYPCSIILKGYRKFIWRLYRPGLGMSDFVPQQVPLLESKMLETAPANLPETLHHIWQCIIDLQDSAKDRYAAGKSMYVKSHIDCLSPGLVPEDAAILKWIGEYTQLSHLNILSPLGIRQTLDGGFGVVLQCTKLQSLREYLNQKSDAERVQLSLQISSGLAYLHEAGIVHGSLRAANVLVSLTGDAMLCHPYLLGSIGSTEQSKKANVRWLAPEIVRGEPMSQAGDSYSLGMEVISGIAPYTKTGVAELWEIVSTGKPSPFPERPMDVIPNNQTGIDSGRFCIVVGIQSSKQAQCSLGQRIYYLYDTGHNCNRRLPMSIALDPMQYKHPASIGCCPDKLYSATKSENDAFTHSSSWALVQMCPQEITCPREIIRHLARHGCENITAHVDTKSFSDHPFATGGFGNIFAGSLHGGLRVAIKTHQVSQSLLEESSNILVDVAREIHTWSKCDHPNVLHFLGLAEFRGQIAMVAPWMDNGTLPRYLKNSPSTDRCRLCTQICDGVAYLHQIGIIHGDLKGASTYEGNTRDGVAVVCDFGGSLLKNRSLNIVRREKGTLTYRWAAPELLYGSNSDDSESAGTASQSNQTTGGCPWNSKASDIYALGMTILEVISGRFPWHWIKNEMAVVLHVCKRGSQHKRSKNIPQNSRDGDKLWSLLTICWSFEPEARPTAVEIGAIVRTVTSEGLLPQPLCGTVSSSH
ncbi:Egl-10, and Pleckstrin (DEP) [Rhizoctonia solani]|uniref:Egl-10, and Pleckstrin (DEP) n=1 Tax=Rhizoctonia solani TaxID=456999 RepID=A0A8H7I4X2_9AGAM|nr:Egl-10, and Pleckstrin (DEP) [Rhizoctonia solani]